MNKNKRLKSRIEKVFTGFRFVEESEEYLYIDIEKTNENILKNKYFGIDSFPKCMGIKSPHGILDVFWDLDKDKSRYLTQEYKFLRSLLLIMSYSKDIIISNSYCDNESKKYINNILNKKESNSLKIVKDYLFDCKDIEFNYDAISSLVKLALRERNYMTIYMLDLEIALEINSLYSNVFLGLNGNIDTVKYICNIEGLYIRDRYLEK